MNDSAPADDPRLVSVAASIAGATPVDWDDTRQHTDSTQTTIVDELRILEGLARMHDPIVSSWGPFDVTGEIGRGSFGMVYRAIDPELQIAVALKVIRPRTPETPLDTERALTEARLLAQINHPNVIRVYRAERIAGEVGVTMELVKGHTLHDIVRMQGPCSAREAMLIGLDLCRALAAVHGAQLLHGDVKAHNVMRAEGGRTVLMDFGAGRDLKQTESRPSGGAGTPVYLAPEVFAGAPRSQASDIYSLGVLLYYLTTAAYPVEGRTRTEVEARHADRAPRTHLRDLRPGLPEAFVRVVEGACAEQPQDRFRSAGALEAALERALVAAPVPVRRAGWRRALIAAGVVAVLGAGSVVGYRLLSAPEAGSPSSLAAMAPVDSTPTPATGPGDGTYQIDAALYREEPLGAARLAPGARIAPGDRLFLRLQASVPIHVYVVSEDEQGEAYLNFPLPGQGVANPLRPGQQHRLPGGRDGDAASWVVTSAGGREHFVIFASPEAPSPAFERMFANLQAPSPGRPVLAQRLSREAIGTLRGVGGLAAAAPAQGHARLSGDSVAPLTPTAESARGVWVRQISLENPPR